MATPAHLRRPVEQFPVGDTARIRVKVWEDTPPGAPRVPIDTAAVAAAEFWLRDDKAGQEVFHLMLGAGVALLDAAAAVYEAAFETGGLKPLPHPYSWQFRITETGGKTTVAGGPYRALPAAAP